jgi:class 3 adenylate cyclase
MASHQLIDDYLAGLARRLPAEVVDELADGLFETWQHHLDQGRGPDQAARAAIAEFGSADRVSDEFVAQSPGRRIARLMLATGPIMALCWGPSLVAAKAWTWPVPRPAAAAYALAFLVVVASLLVAASSRSSWRRTRLGVAGGMVLIGLDAVMVSVAVGLAPVFVWPMALAIPASLGRIGLGLRMLPASRTN